MSYRREVETLLGKERLTKLLNHVRGGNMSDDQIWYFVEQLGKLAEINPNKLLENHMIRMSRDRYRQQDTELIEVMCDWWEWGLYEMTQDKAIDILDRVEAAAERFVQKSERKESDNFPPGRIICTFFAKCRKTEHTF